MSQSLSQLWVHIIFSTKKRFPFLMDHAFRERVYDYMGAICNRLHCNVMAIGGVADHVHLLISLHKNITLSDLVEEIKKSSSKWVKTLDISSDILHKFYWQKGYGAFSVSQSNLEAVKAYIMDQEKHHKRQNFQDELRKFLVHYNVAYKEEYLWD